jgi:hypothetical protein
MTSLSFVEILILILVAIIGTIAIKVTFSLDLNKYLEDRRKRHIPKLQNACTHLEFISNDKTSQVGFRSLFVSPPGTLQWQCQRCGLVKYLDDNELDRLANYYMKNPGEYKRQNKKFAKLLKKSGMI